MITPSQIKKIHALKSEIRLNDDDYRLLLGSYIDQDGLSIWSSKDLNYNQASSLINTLESIIERTPALKTRLYASPKQVWFITSLWKRITRATDDSVVNNTLHSFLNHRFHISRFDRITRKQIGKVIKTLRIMAGRIRLHSNEPIHHPL